MRYLTEYKKNYRISKFDSFKNIKKGDTLQFVDTYTIKKITSPAFAQKILPDSLVVSNFVNVLIQTNSYCNFMQAINKQIYDQYRYIQSNQFAARFNYYQMYMGDKTKYPDLDSYKKYIDSFYDANTIKRIEDIFGCVKLNSATIGNYHYGKNLDINNIKGVLYSRKTGKEIPNLEEYFESYNREFLRKFGIDFDLSFKINGLLYIPIGIKSNSRSLKLVNNEISVADIYNYALGFELETGSKLLGLAQNLKIYKNIQDMFMLLSKIQRFDDLNSLYQNYKSTKKIISSNVFVECIGNGGQIFYLPIDHCNVKINASDVANNLNDLKNSLLQFIK